MNSRAILEAVGEVLGQERKEVRDLIETKLQGLDGAHLLKSTASALLDANVAALQTMCDDILLRKSVVLTGEPSLLVRTLIDKGAPK